MENKYQKYLLGSGIIAASLAIMFLVGSAQNSVLTQQDQTASVISGIKATPVTPAVQTYFCAVNNPTSCFSTEVACVHATNPVQQCGQWELLPVMSGTTPNKTAPSTTNGNKFLTRCHFGGVTMTEGDYFNSTNTYGPPSCTVVINASCNGGGLTLDTTETPVGCGHSGATPVTPANNIPAGLKSKVDSILNNVVPLFSQFKK